MNILSMRLLKEANMLVHHCDICDKVIDTKNEYLKPITVAEDLHSNKFDNYEICGSCYNKICDFINDNREEFINDKNSK